MNIRNRKGMTIPELLVAMFMMIIVISVTYSFYIFFINNVSRERIKANVQKRVESVFSILSDDVRHAGFGIAKTAGKSICLFSIDDNCSVGDETFCKTGSDRFFIANGWQIIRDFTNDNCPDGTINDTVYENIVNKEYGAKINTYSFNKVNVDTLNIDSKCRLNTTMCGDGSCDDIKDNKAVIICGCINSSDNRTTQDGRRIGSINSNNITFVSKERNLQYNNCDNKSRVIPANVWYVRKASDGAYWLYRNQQKVIPDVVSFQVEAGYDNSSNGTIKYLSKIPDNADISKLKCFQFKIEVQYTWRHKTYKINFTSNVDAFH